MPNRRFLPFSTTPASGLQIGRNRADRRTLHLQRRIYAVISLADSMRYAVTQHNGQRYFGPPLHWTGSPPSSECEVFIALIPATVFEDRLVPLLCSVGVLYQLRLMLDFNGLTRGYGFAMYANVEHANRACALLNRFPISINCCLAICKSVFQNNILFIRGIPNVSPIHIIHNIFNENNGVEKVLVTAPGENNKREALVHFATHRQAALARRNMMSKYFELWNTKFGFIVDWAFRHIVSEPFTMEAILDNNLKIFFIPRSLSWDK